MQIKTSGAEFPLAGVAIGRLEVRGCRLETRVDIPAPAALVRHQRELQGVEHLSDEPGILLYGTETIRDGQVGALEIT